MIGRHRQLRQRVRAYCDQLDTQVTICRERNGGRTCTRCTEAARIANELRALLSTASHRHDTNTPQGATP